MKIRYFIACFMLLFLNLHANVENCIEPYLLKEEFNICEYWHDGMTWYEFNNIRNGLQREDLVKYVDKIEQQKMAQEVGLEVPKTYIVSHDKVPITGILSDLSCYVAKMTHLSFSEGLIIVKDGIDIVTGEPITPEQVQERIYKSLEAKPREKESWALHQVKPGFMIQEYIPNRMEVQIQTIWGRAVIGGWRFGEHHMPTAHILGRYDRDGNIVDGSYKAPEWWSEAIAAAEMMAQGTDALRVDFLVREGGIFLLNELEIWPETNWSSMRTELETQLNDGYRNLCG